MRELITNIKSTDYPAAPLFVNVDTSFNGNQGVIFEFLPHVEEEAIMKIRNLIPFFRATEGEYTTAYFYEDAVEAADRFTWDAENNRVICSSDTNMDVDADEDVFGLQTAEEFQSTPQSTTSTNVAEESRPAPTTAESQQQPTTGAVRAYFSSNDSISTMGNSIIDGSAINTTSNRDNSAMDNTSSIISNTYVPVTTTQVTDGSSITSEITSSTISSILRDQQEQRRLLDLILARLPPQQTGQSAGPPQGVRHGGSTADGQGSSAEGL